MIGSFLVNTPVSSPLHPQLNLPLLKAHLGAHGFKSRVVDANIAFYHDMLGEDHASITDEECAENPIRLLEYYNELERILWDRSQRFEGLQVGLRSLSMKQDRLFFKSVLTAVEDEAANPFIAFFDGLIERDFIPAAPRLVGIAVTFQDQVIPAFTLADRLRRRLPDAAIVMGGQMITRCFESMIEAPDLYRLFDYLALWDGEMPIVNIHRKVINGEDADMTNVIDVSSRAHRVDRQAAQLGAHDIPGPDFDDIPFDRYLFPEMLVPLQTTRGCYAKCAFCAIPYGSNGYRVRRAEKVIEDIRQIQDLTQSRYDRKATYFKFMEDTSAPSLLRDIAVEIEGAQLDAKWETFARLEKAFAKPGMLEQLYRGGCRKIHWGLETNDPDVLNSMNKKTDASYTDEILRLSGEAGILNFCFVLVGFPGETSDARERLLEYIINNPHIHTLTISTFDLTRNSPMDEDYEPGNEYDLDALPAEEFQVRRAYTIGEDDWKSMIVPEAHKMMVEIVRHRPDIGFVTLFPDQVRAMFCDKYGNDWGRKFVARYGKENVREMLINTENYMRSYAEKRDIDVATLPEPLKREHFRTKEDMALIAKAVLRRREYEARRINQL